MLTEEEKRKLLVRSKARQFSKEVKRNNLAIKVPDEIFDWLKDTEIDQFKQELKNFGLVQRSDFYWEEMR